MQAMSENEKPNPGLNLVILGKPGAGKSATGNTILGKKAFKLKRRPTSVRQNVAVASGSSYGTTITVYDTPGFTDLTEHEIQLKYQEIFQKCESGPCVFLIVIKADTFTQQDRDDVEKTEKFLGEKRLEKTWILFTGGDELEEENKTIDEFINDLQPLKELVQKYEQGYHVFNNKKPELREQVKILITKFLKKSVGCPDINQIFPGDNHSSKRIVLLGKSGFGKSASGNTILGQKVFNSELNTVSVTRECAVAQDTVSGRSVSVVDTPGFFDTEMKPEELMTEIARSVYLSGPGPHAFLIVLRVDDRFTEQEQQILQMIELMFGQEVLKYSIILFTRGDQLEGKSVEKLIQENCRLRDLVQQCGGRFHVFNNRDENNREQVNDLLQKIDSMIEQNGGHYSNQMFQDAQRFRQENKFEKFCSMYRRFFRMVAIILGVIGGAVVGAAIGTFVASPLQGAVAGGVLGAVAGGAVVSVATARSVVKKSPTYSTSAPSSVNCKTAFSPVCKDVDGGVLSAATGVVVPASLAEFLKGLM